MRAPKPASRPDRVSPWRYLRLFRQDILSSQPARLYRARMAEFRTPFFRSFLVNEPDLVRQVLVERAQDFPKSGRIAEGLRPLLGDSVFLTNGAAWARQRRIIDPAFDAARLGTVFPAMLEAGQAGANRLPEGVVEVERMASHMAADAIFRTLFSMPIEAPLADRVYRDFRAYQRAQPLVNLAAFLPLPRWLPRWHRREATAAAARIRAAIAEMTARRMEEVAAGTAPDDLATKIITTPDPETGECFAAEEMVDQVAIFFLAGHETSASALAWALYLLAANPDAQARVAEEARAFARDPTFAGLSRLRYTRDVFRETLRLYPPVPMMVRQASHDERFRDRDVPAGAQIVVSPWHLHRHERIWPRPDEFDPGRWRDDACPRSAFLPFSMGARVCPGAGFAMAEGPLFLALLLARWEVSTVAGADPVPVAHLTVRSRDGILLEVRARAGCEAAHPAAELRTCDS